MHLFLMVVFWVFWIFFMVFAFVYTIEFEKLWKSWASFIIGLLMFSFIVSSFIQAQDRQNEKINCEYEHGYNSELCK